MKVTVKTGENISIIDFRIQEKLRYAFLIPFNREFLIFVFFFQDSRDWRAHLDQMKQHRSNINVNLSGTKSQLEKLYNDLGNTVDKIKTREMYLNRQLEPVLNEYRISQVEISSLLI